MADPDWLTWTRELQAIARTGLAFSPGDYDRERYEMLRSLASRMMAAHTAASADRIERSPQLRGSGRQNPVVGTSLRHLTPVIR